MNARLLRLVEVVTLRAHRYVQVRRIHLLSIGHVRVSALLLRGRVLSSIELT